MADDLQLETCPYCGKLGLKEIVDGQAYYFHKNLADLRSEPISFGFKYCPEIPPIKSHP